MARRGEARRGEAGREPQMGLLHNFISAAPERGPMSRAFVMRKQVVETISENRRASNAYGLSAVCRTPASEPAKVGERARSPWPFNLGDVTPLEWWRTMPADHFGDAQRLHLRATMEKICVMNDRQWLSALRGDAAASIAIALGAMPTDQVTLEVDLAMSALALCALEGNDASALVLAQILGRTALDHPFGKDISASWLAHNLCRALTAKRHPAPPRRRSKNSNTQRNQRTSPCQPVPA